MFSLFLAYAILAGITALAVGITVFFSFAIWGINSWDMQSWLFGLGFACIIGIIGGVLFPYVWYKQLRRWLGQE